LRFKEGPVRYCAFFTARIARFEKSPVPATPLIRFRGLRNNEAALKNYWPAALVPSLWTTLAFPASEGELFASAAALDGGMEPEAD